ncbi:MAG: rod shape-determining protein MreC [Flavobacteriaceae bacterium]|nr:rod shape-determining protein MreC [Flavobacteriaceae bacterium]
MFQIISLIQKYKVFLIFIFLELLSFILIVNTNRYHSNYFSSVFGGVSGYFNYKSNNISDYFKLQSINEKLIEENVSLKKIINKNNSFSNNYKTKITDTIYRQKYEYISANIVSNNYSYQRNYLILNKGSNEGIKPDMAVVSYNGIIGIVTSVNNNYSRVMSLLHVDSKFNAKIKNNDYFGTLVWNGKSHLKAQLIDIPRQAVLKQGDTIVSGNHSAIFPKGIPIGTVDRFDKKNDRFQDINISLFNDMSSINNVYIVISYDKQEIESLESISK